MVFKSMTAGLFSMTLFSVILLSVILLSAMLFSVILFSITLPSVTELFIGLPLIILLSVTLFFSGRESLFTPLNS